MFSGCRTLRRFRRASTPAAPAPVARRMALHSRRAANGRRTEDRRPLSNACADDVPVRRKGIGPRPRLAVPNMAKRRRDDRPSKGGKEPSSAQLEGPGPEGRDGRKWPTPPRAVPVAPRVIAQLPRTPVNPRISDRRFLPQSAVASVQCMAWRLRSTTAQDACKGHLQRLRRSITRRATAYRAFADIV